MKLKLKSYFMIIIYFISSLVVYFLYLIGKWFFLIREYLRIFLLNRPDVLMIAGRAGFCQIAGLPDCQIAWLPGLPGFRLHSMPSMHTSLWHCQTARRLMMGYIIIIILSQTILTYLLIYDYISTLMHR